MRHPYKFSRALGVSYVITFAIDLSMGIIGYLMFGKHVLEEVTSILITNIDHPKYPQHKRLPPRLKLSCCLHYRSDTNHKNATQYPSDKYHTRYPPRPLADLPPADDSITSPSASKGPLQSDNSDCYGRGTGVDCDCISGL